MWVGIFITLSYPDRMSSTTWRYPRWARSRTPRLPKTKLRVKNPNGILPLCLGGAYGAGHGVIPSDSASRVRLLHILKSSMGRRGQNAFLVVELRPEFLLCQIDSVLCRLKLEVQRLKLGISRPKQLDHLAAAHFCRAEFRLARPRQHFQTLPVQHSEPEIPELNELSLEFRSSFDPPRMDVHVYDDDPSRRFILVDLKRFVEGDTLDSGAKLEKIQPESIQLYYQGTRFLYDR